MALSTTQRYSVGGVILSIILFIAIVWLILAAMRPVKPPVVETVEYPVEEPAPAIDPRRKLERDVYQFATQNGLDGRMVVGIMRTEDIIKTPVIKDDEYFDEKCPIKQDYGLCVGVFLERFNKMEAQLGRKPTPGEMLVTHTLGVQQSIDLIYTPGHYLTKDMNEDLIKLNGVFLRRETVEDLRIWIGKTVYRAMR